MRKLPAFTLVELMVVVAIIMVVTGALIPSFTSYSRRQNVLQAREDLKTDLRTVQGRALSGERSEDLIGGNRARYWGVLFQANAARYYYFLTDVDTLCDASVINQGVGYEDLPNTYTVTADSIIGFGYGCLYFSMSNGAISARNIYSPPSGTDANYSIRFGISSDANQTATVFVNRGGLIY